MSGETVIYDAQRTRRVIVSVTSLGYTFVEEHLSDGPLETAWIPQTRRRSAPVCASFEIAMDEARGRIDWLAALDAR